MMFHFILFLWGVGGIGDNNPSGLIFLASIAIFDMNIAVRSKKKKKSKITLIFYFSLLRLIVWTHACVFFPPQSTYLPIQDDLIEISVLPRRIHLLSRAQAYIQGRQPCGLIVLTMNNM